MRGQATVFIVLGMILLIVIVLVSQQRYRPAMDFEESSLAIRADTQSCLDWAARQAVLVAGAQGGVLYPTGQDLRFGGYRIPIIQRDGRDMALTRDGVALQIASYLTGSFEGCVDYDNYAFNVTTGTPAPEVSIGDAVVNVVMDYPLTIATGDRQRQFDTFAVDIPVRLGMLIDAQGSIIEDASIHADTFDLVQLSNLPFEAEIFTHPAGNYYMFQLVDTDYTLNNQPYRLVFASRRP